MFQKYTRHFLANQTDLLFERLKEYGKINFFPQYMFCKLIAPKIFKPEEASLEKCEKLFSHLHEAFFTPDVAAETFGRSVQAIVALLQSSQNLLGGVDPTKGVFERPWGSSEIRTLLLSTFEVVCNRRSEQSCVEREAAELLVRFCDAAKEPINTARLKFQTIGPLSESLNEKKPPHSTCFNKYKRVYQSSKKRVFLSYRNREQNLSLNSITCKSLKSNRYLKVKGLPSSNSCRVPQSSIKMFGTELVFATYIKDPILMYWLIRLDMNADNPTLETLIEHKILKPGAHSYHFEPVIDVYKQVYCMMLQNNNSSFPRYIEGVKVKYRGKMIDISLPKVVQAQQRTFELDRQIGCLCNNNRLFVQCETNTQATVFLIYELPSGKLRKTISYYCSQVFTSSNYTQAIKTADGHPVYMCFDWTGSYTAFIFHRDQLVRLGKARSLLSLPGQSTNGMNIHFDVQSDHRTKSAISCVFQLSTSDHYRPDIYVCKLKLRL